MMNERQPSLRHLTPPQGKTALQAAMTAPIQTSIMYQNIGAKLFMADSLPEEHPGARDAVSDYMKKWTKNESTTREHKRGTRAIGATRIVRRKDYIESSNI